MKLLVRGYGDPHKPLTVSGAIHQRLLGRNSGNLIFTASAKRNLMTADNEVTVHNFAMLRHRGAEIGEKYDAIVLPLANAFRPGFIDQLNGYTELIKAAKLPVMVLGCGVQASIDYDTSALGGIAAEVKAFVAAVLDHGPSIGVRGRCTQAYLNALGFADVEVIGCPSMFLYGNTMRVRTEAIEFNRQTPIIFSATPHVAMPAGFTRRQFETFPRTSYVAQGTSDLAMMLGGRPVSGADDNYPGDLAHPALRADKTRLFLNAMTWIDQMKGYEFAFGSRIHGNVAPILAGVPSHVIAHDSRTLELAEYFEIPHTRNTDLSAESSAESLYAGSDYGPMMANHAERFRRFTDFLDLHGIDHIHKHEAEPEFDRLRRENPIGDEAIVSVHSRAPDVLAERLWQSTLERQRVVDSLSTQVRALKTEVASLRSAHHRTLASRIKRRLRALVSRRRGRLSASDQREAE